MTLAGGTLPCDSWREVVRTHRDIQDSVQLEVKYPYYLRDVGWDQIALLDIPFVMLLQACMVCWVETELKTMMTGKY